MFKKEVKILAADGLHARPAADFVKKAMEYKETDIKVALGEKEVNAKSMMSVLSLGAASGAEVVLSAEGADEKQAVADLEAILQGR